MMGHLSLRGVLLQREAAAQCWRGGIDGAQRLLHQSAAVALRVPWLHKPGLQLLLQRRSSDEAFQDVLQECSTSCT